MKYYWIYIDCITISGSVIPQHEVSTDHPFKRLKYWLDYIEDKSKQAFGTSYSGMTLINWKEISEEEYNYYNEHLSDFT